MHSWLFNSVAQKLPRAACRSCNLGARPRGAKPTGRRGRGHSPRRARLDMAIRMGSVPAARQLGEPGVWANGRQRDSALALHTSFREQVLMPTARPDVRALLRSQAGPHAGAWFAAIPADAATKLAPDLMHLAFRRRVRLPLPLTRARCSSEGAPGCRAIVDSLGDHALACPRTGLLARRGFVLERAWIHCQHPFLDGRAARHLCLATAMLLWFR